MAANSARVQVGRLLEVSVRSGYRTIADVDTLFDAIDRALAVLPAGQQHVTCADWRSCTVMAQETSDRLKQRLSRTNARTERSAAIARPDSPTAVMQFLRLIREANLPERKVFLHPEEAVEWLGEVLLPAEVARLRLFLNATSESARDAT